MTDADRLEAQAAALQEVVAQFNTWQPIATAPKDGTEVLVAGIEQDSAYVAAFHDGDWWTPDTFPHGWTNLLRGPTHWMPLPSPPATGEAS